MTDYRFLTPGTDSRFPGGGVDNYFDNGDRFSGGKDLRYEAPGLGPAPSGNNRITRSGDRRVTRAANVRIMR